MRLTASFSVRRLFLALKDTEAARLYNLVSTNLIQSAMSAYIPFNFKLVKVEEEEEGVDRYDLEMYIFSKQDHESLLENMEAINHHLNQISENHDDVKRIRLYLHQIYNTLNSDTL